MALAPESAGSARGGAADSLGKDARRRLSNHLQHLRVGHRSPDKDKDSSIDKALHSGSTDINIKQCFRH